MKLSILQKGLIIVSIPLLFEVFFVAILVGQLDKTAEQIKIETRSQDIIISVETILREIADSTTTAIIYNVTRRPDLLVRNIESRKKIFSNIARLKRLTKHDSEERQAASRIEASARNWTKNQQVVLNAEPKNNLGAFFFMRGNREMGSLLVMRSEGAGKTIIERENEIQSIQPKRLKKSIFDIQILLLFGAIVNITLTIFLAMYFAKYIAQRLDNVLTNTYKLGARMELNPPLRGMDEIAVLDQALHEAATEIIEFESFKEELIGVVSHELRTPLTSIQGTLTLLSAGAMGEYPKQLTEMVDETQGYLNQLINLVNDLLLIERLEAGSQVVKEEELELLSIIDRAYETVKKGYVRAHENIIVTGEPVSVIGDTTLLERAFSILLLLSQERLSGKRETLVIVDQSPDGISIIAEDNAKEIPQEEHDQYFTRNIELPKDEEHEPGVSDVLSKSLLKSIITAHLGSISINSTKESTSFTITLPYRRPKQES